MFPCEYVSYGSFFELREASRGYKLRKSLLLVRDFGSWDVAGPELLESISWSFVVVVVVRWLGEHPRH